MKKIDLKRFRAADHRVLRDINEAIVLNLIREGQPVSRVAIAEASGLEEGTISRIIQRFLRQGLVFESGAGPSTPAGGRKPRFLHINPTKRCAIGVDIGPLETMLALSDLNGHLHHLKRIPHSHDEPQHFLQSLAEQINALIKTSNPYQEFAGVGVGLPGLLDIEEGTILEGENLGWGENIAVGNVLRSRIPAHVPIFYENSARLCALGEIWFGTTQLLGFRNLVFVDVSEGVGTGIIINGQIYHGHHHGAGEFGHICLDPAGPVCSCGSRGCLEAFASDLATLERFRKKTKTEGASSRSRHASQDINALIELARQGDSIALECVQETAHFLGIGLAPIIYGLNPEAIVIGGKIAEIWPLLSPVVLKSLATRVSPPYLNGVKILASTLHIRPSLLGAISLVLGQDFAAPDIL